MIYECKKDVKRNDMLSILLVLSFVSIAHNQKKIKIHKGQQYLLGNQA